MQLNEIFFAGFVGKDASDHTGQSGNRVVSFNVCQTTRSKNGGKDVSTWVRVKAFSGWAEYAAQIKKGDNVFVVGKLNISEYTDKNNVKQTNVEILASALSVLRKQETRTSDSTDTQAAPPADDFYDNIPF